VLLLASPARAADWPQWGHDNSRNMVAHEESLPIYFKPGKPKPGSEEIDPTTTQNVRWVAKLGSQSYGNPIVVGGRVFVGTNNESPRDPKIKGDRGVIMAFDEKTGAFLWQLAVPKLGSGKVNDWEYLGITASAAVEGDRLYILTNRCEVLCLDVNGMSNGNQGTFMDEAQYLGGPGNPKIEPGPTDGDILWRYDMVDELGVFPHNATSSSPLILGDRMYVGTSNGVDWGHINIPSPLAPALIALDKKTGTLLGEESSGLSSRTFHSNWSSPTYGKVKGKNLIFFGAGDGWVYAFGAEPVKNKEGLKVLPLVWKFDMNPPEYKMKDGQAIKYPAYNGPSEVIMTPVFFKNRLYVSIGQDPEHGSGIGRIVAIDPTGSGDVTKTKKVWSYEGIGRSISTPAIADGRLYTADFDGHIYAIDLATGKVLWNHDSQSHIWGSPLVADDKVYIGNEDGFLMIFAASPEEKLLASIDMHAPVYSTPVAANGTLFVATHTQLYAIAAPTEVEHEKPGPQPDAPAGNQ
jgi:outer membrane protein assembly factor BamB